MSSTITITSIVYKDHKRIPLRWSVKSLGIILARVGINGSSSEEEVTRFFHTLPALVAIMRNTTVSNSFSSHTPTDMPNAKISKKDRNDMMHAKRFLAYASVVLESVNVFVSKYISSSKHKTLANFKFISLLWCIEDQTDRIWEHYEKTFQLQGKVGYNIALFAKKSCELRLKFIFMPVSTFIYS